MVGMASVGDLGGLGGGHVPASGVQAREAAMSSVDLLI